MSTNRKLVLLALMAIVLFLTLTSCDSGSPGETNAEVRVIGSSAKTATTLSVSSRSNQQGFSSGEIFIGDENITDRLTATPATGQNGTNNLEFTTTVEVPAVEKIEYRVEPKSGFVFDEWEFDRRNMLRRDYPNDWRSIMMENNGEDSDGSSTKPFKDMAALIKFITDEKWQYFDDDELTIKIKSGTIDSLDLSDLTDSTSVRRYWDDDELEIELTIAGGYNDNWNVSSNKTVIEKIVLPDFDWSKEEVEIEIEFRNIEFIELDYSMTDTEIGDYEVEMDFRNCEVGALKNARGVINGLIVKSIDSSSSNLTFVNSVAPYNSNYTYYHSIVKNWTSGDIKGQNNIVVGGKGPENDANNHYIINGFDGYKTDNPDLIEELMQATPLVENQIKFGDDDDILEEDIEGRDRFLFDDDYSERDDDDWDDDKFDDDAFWGSDYRNIKVSYGPYEYRWD